MDQDPNLQPPYTYSAEQIINVIQLPEDDVFYRYGVLPIENAFTRLHAKGNLSAAEIALQLTTESFGSPVHLVHIAALMRNKPHLFVGMSDAEKRFFVEIGITNELNALEQRIIALTHDLLPSGSNQELLALVEQKNDMEFLQTQLCERTPVAYTSPAFTR